MDRWCVEVNVDRYSCGWGLMDGWMVVWMEAGGWMEGWMVMEIDGWIEND